jgi:hypothetical protein
MDETFSLIMWVITDGTPGTAFHKVTDTNIFKLHNDGTNFIYD